MIPMRQNEHDAVRLAGQLYAECEAIIEDGETREADLTELRIHIHAIQHAIMAQSAARTFPRLYRLLGQTVEEDSTPGVGADHT
jgi:hypothetical protein